MNVKLKTIKKKKLSYLCNIIGEGILINTYKLQKIKVCYEQMSAGCVICSQSLKYLNCVIVVKSSLSVSVYII